MRVQLEYVNSTDGLTVILKRSATINSGGRWSVNSKLSPGIIAQIARRFGKVHSYTLFTGYFPRRIRARCAPSRCFPHR